MAISDAKTDWKKLSQEALEDRRKGKRINLRFEVEVCGHDVAGNDYRMGTHTRDVSENGCCFVSNKELLKGEVISLGVIHRNGSGVAEVRQSHRYHIAWVVQEKEMWVVGAEMIDPAKPWGVSFPPKSTVARFS